MIAKTPTCWVLCTFHNFFFNKGCPDKLKRPQNTLSRRRHLRNHLIFPYILSSPPPSIYKKKNVVCYLTNFLSMFVEVFLGLLLFVVSFSWFFFFCQGKNQYGVPRFSSQKANYYIYLCLRDNITKYRIASASAFRTPVTSSSNNRHWCSQCYVNTRTTQLSSFKTFTVSWWHYLCPGSNNFSVWSRYDHE